jgi:hypothetical protein
MYINITRDHLTKRDDTYIIPFRREFKVQVSSQGKELELHRTNSHRTGIPSSPGLGSGSATGDRIASESSAGDVTDKSGISSLMEVIVFLGTSTDD